MKSKFCSKLSCVFCFKKASFFVCSNRKTYDEDKGSLKSSEDAKLIEKKYEEKAMSLSEEKSRNWNTANWCEIRLSMLHVPEPASLDQPVQEWIVSQGFPINQQYKSVDAENTVSLHSSKNRGKLLHSVLRFHRDIDKLSHLCSNLFKSRAYHLYHIKNSNQKKKKVDSKLAIMDLPRNQKNKPFIPDAPDHIFSLSHQHPFVAAVQLNGNSHEELHRLKVGIDLVVMEREEERIEAYKYLKDAFTVQEWERVSKLESERLEWAKEILLIWSMKEAYTKALGLGMELNFSNFEICLEEIEEDGVMCSKNAKCESSWNKLLSQKGSDGFKTRGRVIQYIGPNTDLKFEKTGYWNFTFFDAFNMCVGAQVNHENELPLLSCACVCDGPHFDTNNIMKNSEIPIHVEIMSLTELVNWHALGNENLSKVV